MNLWVALGIVAAGTAVMAMIVRGKRTPAPVATLVLGLSVGAFIVGLTANSRTTASDRKADRREASAAAQAAAIRAYDAQIGTYTACVSKVGTRADIRTVLFSMVDLSDLFPDNALAQQYTASRRALIDAKYPSLDVATACGPQPEPPTPTT